MAKPANHLSSRPKADARFAQSPASSEGGSAGGLRSLEPGLYIVATPIGNLRDITLRALDVLAEADIIYAEDTRTTGKLLAAYSIKTRLTAYHDHNAAKRIAGVIKLIEDGAAVALVSDAGTPLVSDPGFKLARDVAAAGHKVVPLPGASAALAGLTVSGLPSDRFLFAGFLPNKSKARMSALSELSSIKASLIFFEAGTRIAAMLEDCRMALGDRPMALARELTKHYEETRRGLISDVLDTIKRDPPRGEIVVIIGGTQLEAPWDESRIDEALLPLINELGVKRAATEVAKQSGQPKREIYARAQSLKDGQ